MKMSLFDVVESTGKSSGWRMRIMVVMRFLDELDKTRFNAVRVYLRDSLFIVQYSSETCKSSRQVASGNRDCSITMQSSEPIFETAYIKQIRYTLVHDLIGRCI